MELEEKLFKIKREKMSELISKRGSNTSSEELTRTKNTIFKTSDLIEKKIEGKEPSGNEETTSQIPCADSKNLQELSLDMAVTKKKYNIYDLYAKLVELEKNNKQDNTKNESETNDVVEDKSPISNDERIQKECRICSKRKEKIQTIRVAAVFFCFLTMFLLVAIGVFLDYVLRKLYFEEFNYNYAYNSYKKFQSSSKNFDEFQQIADIFNGFKNVCSKAHRSVNDMSDMIKQIIDVK